MVFGSVLALPVALVAASGLMAAISDASLGAAIPAIVLGGPIAMGVIIGIAALGGLIHSKVSPIEAEDIQSNSEKAQAAMNFEKDPQTEAGLHKGGIAGGIFSGLWGGGTVVGAAGYAMQNLTSVGQARSHFMAWPPFFRSVQWLAHSVA